MRTLPVFGLGLVTLFFSLQSASAATVYVLVGDGGSLSFTPASISIAVGDTVNWGWAAESGQHDVRQTSDAKSCEQLAAGSFLFGSEEMSSGNYTFKFDKAGTYYYICTIGGHCRGGMRGVVNVGGSSSASASAAASTTASAALTTTTAAPATTSAASTVSSVAPASTTSAAPVTTTSKPALASRLSYGSAMLAGLLAIAAILIA